jgi:hypothetical protein
MEVMECRDDADDGGDGAEAKCCGSQEQKDGDRLGVGVGGMMPMMPDRAVAPGLGAVPVEGGAAWPPAPPLPHMESPKRKRQEMESEPELEL